MVKGGGQKEVDKRGAVKKGVVKMGSQSAGLRAMGLVKREQAGPHEWKRVVVKRGVEKTQGGWNTEVVKREQAAHPGLSLSTNPKP